MSAAQRKTGSRMLLKKTRINKICTNMLRLCFHNYALLCLPTNIFAKICAYYVCTRPPWWTWCRWAVETQRRWHCSLHHATCLKNVKDQRCRQLFALLLLFVPLANFCHSPAFPRSVGASCEDFCPNSNTWNKIHWNTLLLLENTLFKSVGCPNSDRMTWCPKKSTVLLIISRLLSTPVFIWSLHC